MKKPPKTHLLSYENESKTPKDDSIRILGYHATECGYQRKNVASDPHKVNCILCLAKMEKRGL